MNTLYKLFLLPLALFGMFPLTVTAQNEPDTPSSTEIEEESIYEKMSSLPKTPFLFGDTTAIHGSKKGIPAITRENLDYLSSLSEHQLDSLQNAALAKLGPDAKEKIAQNRQEKIEMMTKLLGGQAGIEKFDAFFESYLASNGGEEEFYKLLPKGLDEQQEEFYAIEAVYIDRVARPIFNRLTGGISLKDL